MVVVTSRTTLSTVARRAGVSLATASKVLNGRAGVGEETRDRVKQAMIDLGYRPSTARADDPGSKVRRIDILFNSLSENLYVPEILNEMMLVAEEFGMEIIPRLIDQPAPAENADEWARMLLGGGCQGAVSVAVQLSNEQLRALDHISMPLIGVDSDYDLTGNMIMVEADNFTGGYLVAKHLLDLGHRRIGIISGRESARFARKRTFGELAALLEIGIELSDELIVQEPFTYEGGLHGGARLLALPDPPTAIIANCDAGAIGVLEAARLAGLSIPSDLSVVGFDDTKIARWSAPQLTTVHQPLDDIARVALSCLNAILDGRPVLQTRFQVPTKLVVRASSAPPRSAD
jgi:LacI family transcriptional regulator